MLLHCILPLIIHRKVIKKSRREERRVFGKHIIKFDLFC